MSEAETILREVRSLREVVADLRSSLQSALSVIDKDHDRFIGRQEMAERLDISPSTLDRRVKSGTVPRPVNGKWLLSEVRDWEMQQKGKAA